MNKWLIVGGFDKEKPFWRRKLMLVVPNKKTGGAITYSVPRWFGLLLKKLKLAL